MRAKVTQMAEKMESLEESLESIMEVCIYAAAYNSHAPTPHI